MPARLEVADVTCAASVPTTTPFEVALNFPTGILRRVTIIIPDGHSGLTGIALGYGHNAVLPGVTGAFISGNDEKFTFDYQDDQPGVPWSAFLVNLDIQAHTWEVRFEYDELNVKPPTAAPVMLQPADITAAALALTEPSA